MIGRDGHARLLDFGLARNLQSDGQEDSGTISGTVTAPGSLSGGSITIYDPAGSFVTSASVNPVTGA